MSEAIIVIDVQNCFLPGGSLATTNERDSNASTPPTTLANGIKKFIEQKSPAHVFITLDWHTPGHSSFAKANAGEIPITSPPNAQGTRLRLAEYKGRNRKARVWGDNSSRDVQALWPEHCVQDSDGAKLAPELESFLAGKAGVDYVYKGDEPTVDSYSAVANALGFPTPHLKDGTPFLTKLQGSDLRKVYITGIARDVCVFWTALDLLEFWILPAYKSGTTIKLSFVYDLTRPVFGAAPAFNKTKAEIETAVKSLITATGHSESIYGEVFEIVDSGLYSGGRRRKAHTRKQKTRSCKKCSRKYKHKH
jgi:nicotinamidase-related amidase